MQCSDYLTSDRDRPGTGSNVSRQPLKNLILAGTIVIVWGILVATVRPLWGSQGQIWWVPANDRPLAGLLLARCSGDFGSNHCGERACDWLRLLPIPLNFLAFLIFPPERQWQFGVAVVNRN